MMCCIVHPDALQQSQDSNIIDKVAGFCPDKLKKIMVIMTQRREIGHIQAPSDPKMGLVWAKWEK